MGAQHTTKARRRPKGDGAATAEGFDRGRGDRFVSFRELLFRLGHPSRMQVYRRIKAGQLPEGTKPFGGKRYWRESEIDAVIAGKWRPAPDLAAVGVASSTVRARQR
jgi:predicted DNA-binding transcriptional regulator AlpA